MKQNYFFLFLILLILSSCNNEENLFSNDSYENVIEQSAFGESSLDKLKTHAVYYVNDEKALVFSSLEDYGFLLDSISKITDEEFSEWENRIGFESYRTFVNNIMEKTIETDRLQFSYPNFFEKNKELNLVIPKIKSYLYQSIVNKDGFFYIGNTKNIVNGDCVTNQGENINSKLDQNTSYSINPLSEQIGNAIEYPVIDYTTNDLSRVMTWFKIYRLRGSNGTATLYNTVLEIAVRPRSWFGVTGWSDTESVCYVEEVKLHMNGLGLCSFYNEDGIRVMKSNEFMALKTSRSSKALKIWNLSIVMNSSMMDPGMLYDPYCVHYRARTGKTGKWGAAYNTYHPAPDMGPACQHRIVTEYQNQIYDF